MATTELKIEAMSPLRMELRALDGDIVGLLKSQATIYSKLKPLLLPGPETPKLETEPTGKISMSEEIQNLRLLVQALVETNASILERLDI